MNDKKCKKLFTEVEIHGVKTNTLDNTKLLTNCECFFLNSHSNSVHLIFISANATYKRCHSYFDVNKESPYTCIL